MSRCYMYVSKVNGVSLFNTSYNAPTPPVLTPSMTTWMVTLVAPGGTIPSPLPVLTVQPVVDGVNVGAPVNVSVWPAMISVDMSTVAAGQHWLAVIPQGADPTVYNPFAATVIVGHATDMMPVVPCMYGMSKRREPMPPEWVVRSDILDPLPMPRSFPDECVAYTNRPTSGQLIFDAVMPHAGYLWDVMQIPVKNAAGDVFVVGVLNENNARFDLAAPVMDRFPSWDGPRGVGFLSSYITGMVDLHEPDVYFVDTKLKRARFGRITPDGTITTLAGYRTVDRIIYNPYDTSASITTAMRDAQWERVGTCDVDLSAPTDLVQDPRPGQGENWYVADALNHRIAKVTEDGEITTYAGVPGVAGFQDGFASLARFNRPTSLTMAPDGTMYVADWWNNRIRMISPDGQQVTSLGVPATNPPAYGSVPAYQTARTLYMKNGALSQATWLYPFCIRIDSQGRLLVKERSFASIRRIDLTAQTVTLMYTNATSAASEWQWLAVNVDGTCGPVDDVFLATDTGGGDNINIVRIFNDFSGEVRVLDFLSGIKNCGHYPWLLACGLGAIWVGGLGAIAVTRVRQKADGDFDLLTQPQWTQFMLGEKVYLQGGSQYTEDTSPIPSFSLLHGLMGGFPILTAHSFNEIAAMSDTDAATLLRNGWGGTPRSISDPDMAALLFFLRTSAQWYC